MLIILCDLISDVITCYVWSCNKGQINASDKIMFENQKRRKYGNIFYINLHLKDLLQMKNLALKAGFNTI